MANFTGKDQAFSIDDAAGSPAVITAHVTNVSLTGNPGSHLQDTALGDDEHTFVYGVAAATVDITGFWNSTTKAIYGPLIGNRTSVTKSVVVTAYSGATTSGEVLVGDVATSGAVDTVLTFTASHTFTGVTS